jgi:iron complex outermembrane recepter protein
LLDNTYALGGYPVAGIGFDSAIMGEPRMFGVSLKFRFGNE